MLDDLIVYSGGCYEMLLCFLLLARGCPGGMEHAAASQVMHSGLYLLVRGVVQVSNFLLLSAPAQTSWPSTVTGGG